MKIINRSLIFLLLTVRVVAADIAQYGANTARLFILTDDAKLAHVIRSAQEHGATFSLQVKSETGDGGDPNDNSRPCPGSPGCP